MFNKIGICILLIIPACISTLTVDQINPSTGNLHSSQANLILNNINHPEGNSYSSAKAELGERLFFDPALSSDGKLSCASCHIPEFAFSDTVAISLGAELALNPRNTPSLLNIGVHKSFMWDGGLHSLETQVLVPFGDDGELQLSISEATKKISMDSDYIQFFKTVFDTIPNPYSITQAIACYERTLISTTGKFDIFLMDNNSDVLNDQEKRGWELFNSDRTNCSRCHSGVLLTNFKFENIGLYQQYQDPGRRRITDRVEDEGKFKVPSLRNISLTAPYMHDGSIANLEEILEFYRKGGEAHPNKSEFIKEFELTESEREDLLAFLRCLIDDSFINPTQNISLKFR